jgi:hypothetical protein
LDIYGRRLIPKTTSLKKKKKRRQSRFGSSTQRNNDNNNKPPTRGQNNSTFQIFSYLPLGIIEHLRLYEKKIKTLKKGKIQ